MSEIRTEAQPTEEQIKELWEWCGLVYINNPIAAGVANSCEAMIADKPLNGWYFPDYAKGTSKLVSFKETLALDLNNLFKWAVPQLDGYMMFTGEGGVHFIASKGNVKSEAIAEKEELAVFWAILLVIDKEN